MFPELLRAVLELGLPVAALTWLLFNRLYSRGEIARDADHKAIGASLKEIRKTAKGSKQPYDSLVHSKWMTFGGGFYGMAAAWTLLVIEASGVAGFIAHPSSVEDVFRHGVGNFIGAQVSGQIGNFVHAAIWFTWWPDKGHGPVAWFVVAYLAYLAGLNLARRESAFGRRLVDLDSRAKWRSLIGRGERSAVGGEREEQQSRYVRQEDGEPK
jgi:hypothetical protein